MRVKIVERGFAGFTGDFGIHPFVDGVSVHHMSPMEAAHLGALVQVEEYVEEGENSHRQLGTGAVLVERHNSSVPYEALEREQEIANEVQKELAAEEIILYTYDELANVADREGISGLRPIAKNWEVRGRTIPDLIEGIEKAQNKYKKRQTGLGD